MPSPGGEMNVIVRGRTNWMLVEISIAVWGLRDPSLALRAPLRGRGGLKGRCWLEGTPARTPAPPFGRRAALEPGAATFRLIRGLAKAALNRWIPAARRAGLVGSAGLGGVEVAAELGRATVSVGLCRAEGPVGLVWARGSVGLGRAK